ncbi:hypothetical protein D3C85_1229220 [compost metagenome]
MGVIEMGGVAARRRHPPFQHMLHIGPGVGAWGQRVHSARVVEAELDAVVHDVGGRIILGEAFHEPGRIGVGAHLEHEVVGVFVEHHDVAHRAARIHHGVDAFAVGGIISCNAFIDAGRDAVHVSPAVGHEDFEFGNLVVRLDWIIGAQQGVEAFHLAGVAAQTGL